MIALSSGFGVLMMSVAYKREQMGEKLTKNCDLANLNLFFFIIKHYLLRPAFWECPGVSQLCQTPGSGSPEDHPK